MDQALDRPWVHLALGNLARELDSKVLLAAVLLKRNFNVSLGYIHDLHRAKDLLPRGIHIGVRFSRVQRAQQEQYKARDFKLGAFDEEAPSFPDKDYYQKYMISGDVLGMLDAAFCWGEPHAEVVRGVLTPEQHHLVKSIGHPRFDLLRKPCREFYKPDVVAIRERYGPFILFNSNAGGWRLEGRVEERWQQVRDRYMVDATSESYQFFVEKYEHGLKRHQKLMRLAERIAREFPNHKVIIRPHPSESLDYWNSWLPKGLNNIVVVRDGSAIPWMMAAELVLHSSCTTGTEGFLAGANVVSYLDDAMEGFDAELPNALSVRVRFESEAMEIVQRALAGGGWSLPDDERKPRQALAESHYSALTGPLSSEQLALIFEKLAFTPNGNGDRFNDMSPSRKRKIVEPSAGSRPIVEHGFADRANESPQRKKRNFRDEIAVRLNNVFAAMPDLAQPVALSYERGTLCLLTQAADATLTAGGIWRKDDRRSSLKRAVG